MFGSIARAKRYYKNDAAVYEIITLPYQCSLGHLTSGHELEGHRGYMQTATINVLVCLVSRGSLQVNKIIVMFSGSGTKRNSN
jgi:hypothetical protein